MKFSNFIFLTIFNFIIFSCTQINKTTNNENITIEKTDKNGYKYEIVTNDLTGTRLYTLKNGLKVYLSQNYDEPRIYSIIAVKAGSAFDPSDNTGLAHYLEHIMFNGNSKIGALNWNKEKTLLKEIENLYELKKNSSDKIYRDNINAKIDSLSFESSKISSFHEYKNLLKLTGTVIPNGITNVDHTIYTSLTPSNSINKFLTLEAERFRNMEPRSFQKELQIVYEEYNKEMDDIWEKKYYAITEKIFEKHPYGQQKVIGTSEHLKNSSIKAIREYFNKYYVPNNMSITLVGDLKFDETIKLVDSTLGKLQKKKLNRLKLPVEDEIDHVRKLDLFDSNEESVYIGFRYKDANSKEEKYVTMIDLLLANGSAGYFDTELKSKQLVKDAKSYIIKNRDYGIHLLDGYPKQNQTLEEVEELLLSQLDRIKNGNFDDWMIDAVINKLKVEQNENFSRSGSLANIIFTDFINDRSWENRLSYIEELSKIKKQDIVEFANKFYDKNYVILYKRFGKSVASTKVEKQKITPLFDNTSEESQFAKEYKDITVGKTDPVFLDFKKEIQSELVNNIRISHIDNDKNSNFKLNFIYNVGSNDIKKLPVVIDFIKLLGTKKYLKSDLEREYFKNGLKMNFRTNTNKTIVEISGPKESLNKGVELYYHFLNNVIASDDEFNEFIKNAKKTRLDNKTNIRQVRYNLMRYALYNQDYYGHRIIKNNELNEITQIELMNVFKQINKYGLEIFYYGKEYDKAFKALKPFLSEERNTSNNLTSKKIVKKNSENVIYFVNNNDLKQADVSIISRTEKFNIDNLAYNNLLNFYLSNTFGKEIREKRALFYSGYSVIDEASKIDGYDNFRVYAGTQSNKLEQALEAILNYINKLPFNEIDFNVTKTDLIKRYEASRTNGSNIFWMHEDLKRKGIMHDIMKDKYEKIKTLSLSDLENYYRTKIKTHNKTILVIANKDNVNLENLKRFGKVIELTISDVFGY